MSSTQRSSRVDCVIFNYSLCQMISSGMYRLKSVLVHRCKKSQGKWIIAEDESEYSTFLVIKWYSDIEYGAKPAEPFRSYAPIPASIPMQTRTCRHMLYPHPKSHTFLVQKFTNFKYTTSYIQHPTPFSVLHTFSVSAFRIGIMISKQRWRLYKFTCATNQWQ